MSEQDWLTAIGELLLIVAAYYVGKWRGRREHVQLEQRVRELSNR